MKLYSPANQPSQKKDILKGFDELLKELEERIKIFEEDEAEMEPVISVLEKVGLDRIVREPEDIKTLRTRHHNEIQGLRKKFASDAFGVIPEEVLDKTSTLFKQNLMRVAVELADYHMTEDPKRPNIHDVEQVKIRILVYATAYGTLMRDGESFDFFNIYPFGNSVFPTGN